MTSVPSHTDLTVVFVITIVCSTVPSATMASGPLVLDTCATITEPGQYTLQGDIWAATDDVCITVRTDDVVIDGNGFVLHATGERSSLALAANAVSNVTVRRLGFANWSQEGILFTNVTHGVIDHNRFDNSGGLSLIDSANLTVADNTFVGDKESGVTLRRTHSTLVEENTGVHFGFSVSESANNQFSRNVISGHTEIGFNVVNSDRNELVANRIGGNVESGVLLFGSDENLVSDNTVLTWRTGVRLQESTRNIVTDNTVVGFAEEGINVFDGSDDNVFTRNSISDSLSPGFTASDSRNLIISDNTITRTGSGFNVQASGSSVVNNSVSQTDPIYGFGGILVVGDDIAVVNNTVTKSEYGIIADGPGSYFIASNSIEENNRTGIVLAAGRSTVSGNVVAENARGISIGRVDWRGHSSEQPVRDSLVAGNVVHSNHEHGIVVRTATETVLSSNRVVANTGDGIYLWGGATETTLVENLALENGDDGIELYRTENSLLIRNRAVANGDNGVFLLEVHANELVMNVARANAANGFFVADSERVLLVSNIAQENGDDGVDLLSVDGRVVETTACDNGAAAVSVRGATDRTRVIGTQTVC